MRPQKLGATPALILSAATAATIAAVGALVAFHGPNAPAASAVNEAPPTATAPAATVTGQHTPARDTLAALLGEDVTWGSKVPAPFGCTITPGAINGATRDGTSAHAYPAGQATTALNDLRRCGRSTKVLDAPAVRMSAVGGEVLAWTRGDVLVTIAAPTVDPARAEALDGRLRELLGGVCTDLNPQPTDATRNPANPQYAGWSREEAVTIPPLPQAARPTPSATPASEIPVPDITDLTLPVMPNGIPGPPLPAAVTKPTRPTDPGAEPSTTTVTVTVEDTAGPGCGWTFTGQTPPAIDVKALQSEAKRVKDNATVDLVTRQQTWAADVTAYQAALLTYITDATAWNAYAQQVEEVATSWRSQAAELATYNAAVKQYNSAVQARDDFIARQSSAQVQFDAAVTACQQVPVAPVKPAVPPMSSPSTPSPTPSPTGSPAPSPTPTPSPTVTQEAIPTETEPCAPARPQILDETPPVVPPMPQAPTLWVPPTS